MLLIDFYNIKKEETHCQTFYQKVNEKYNIIELQKTYLIRK